jgi:sortase A
MDHYRRTGRVIHGEDTNMSATLADLRSVPLADEDLAAAAPARRSGGKNSVLSRLLLLVEVAAVAGLIFVLFNGANLMRSLNQEVSAAMQQPTLTPTPLIMAVVLPSGHTPPNSAGGVQPNEAEIPEHLRPLVQSLADIPIPTPGPQQAVRIQIPAISVDHPVVQGDGYEQLKKGVGQFIGSPNPGQVGNIVLSAHNDVFGEIFRDLDQLNPGDEVVLFTNQRTFTYVVQDTKIVEPTQVEVMAPTNEPVVTLISCYPYLVDNKRIVVRAYLKEGS